MLLCKGSNNEWRRGEGATQPYHLKLKTEEPLALAGLFDVWRDRERRIVSVTILTTQAPEELSWLHERMPVLLNYDDYDLWLDRGTPDIAELTDLLTPHPTDELELYPVSREVNNAWEDKPDFVVALTPPNPIIVDKAS